jgi:hypothetical protein
MAVTNKLLVASLAAILVAAFASKAPAQISEHRASVPVKNIVLVHGAWVDASGWKPVYEILTKDGYAVTMVQEPLTSFEDDVAATKRILDLQTAAWKTKPSWAIVAAADRIINPDLERMYYKRAHSHMIELEGASHSVYESRPKEVAAVIEAAAQHAQE